MADDGKIAALEARVEGLHATLTELLSTLVLHGLLTKPAVDKLLSEAGAHAKGAGAGAEVDTLKTDYPAAIREAMGPPGDEHDHDH
ncbi:MAG TPA: hypothetical protein VIL72_11635 [Beijerinckiaceae bacterium]|jgi:hypothetical protein